MRNSMKMLLLGVLFALVFVVVPEKAEAYSYSAWVGLTGDKTFAVNPFLSGALNGTSYTDFDVALEFGINKTMDFIISPAGWGLYRWDLSGGKNLGIVALYADAANLGVQYHMTTDIAKAFTLEGNVTYTMPYGDMLGGSTIGAIIAPVIHFNEARDVSFYLELDPSYSFSGGGSFSFKIVPGFSFLDGTLSVGFPIEGLTTGNVSVSYAAWLWVGFGHGAK